ncbi:COX15/CtaA family protein [Rarobacter incanus]|uniref:COX15/CtaA family protein n=1 Tax=Rarobacter incanus TaxID=153494 RepID=UPI001477837F|nr:COX15/CtaA family protein [Rarobacter incanus]
MTAKIAAPNERPVHPSPVRWFQRHGRVFVWANLMGQMLIIVTGGLVRLTGSGLGCSTWPMCEPGQFTPVAHQATTYHPFVEFGNRTISGVLVAIALAVLLAVWTDSTRTRAYRMLGLVPLIGVLAQAIIGGITVLAHLNPAIVGFHMFISIALVAFSAYLVARHNEGDGRPVATVDIVTARITRAVATWLGVVVCLGVIVTGSGPHSGDDEVAYRFALDPAAMARAHAGTVWILIIALAMLSIRLLRGPAAPHGPLRKSVAAIWVIVLVEGAVGYTQYFTGLPWGLVAVHMALAALLTAAAIFAVTATRTRA